MNPNIRQTILRIACLGGVTVVIRCIALYLFSGSFGFEANYPDESNYYLPAAQMLRDLGLGFFLSPRSLWNGPLNPLWIALFQGHVPLVKFVNVLLFSIASAFLAGGVGVSFGWRRASLVALGLLVFPPTYQLVPTLLTEPL
jgi:hypothetical protein